MKKTNKIIVFDLDGTLADITDRRTLADVMKKGKMKMNWKVFFDPLNVAKDKPNVPVIDSFKALKAAGNTMVIFSGRDSISKDITKLWLKNHGVDYDFLKMRPQGSHTPDDTLKKDWMDDLNVDGLTKDDVLMIFDDRNKVVDMWRDNGFTCFQVAPGDF